MREGVRGVIESSLYQIMTGAILSVLGRCSVCAFVPCFSFCCTLLAERTKSNDESNSIIFPSLPSHSSSHFFPLFFAQLFPLNCAQLFSSGRPASGRGPLLPFCVALLPIARNISDRFVCNASVSQRSASVAHRCCRARCSPTYPGGPTLRMTMPDLDRGAEASKG